MIKRIFDILFSIIGIIILSPLFFIVSIFIKIETNGPVFYKGIRIGKDEKLFKIYKFRTMIVRADKIGPSSTTEDDSRLTKVGKFIRKYKLDEFPQFINVLKGEMSFVGPRPQVPWAVKLYNKEEKRLLSVKPGITDYASIKFPDEEKILKGSKNPDSDYMKKIHPEKMRLGLEYVKNHSFFTDLKIILKTIRIIFK